MLTSCINNTYSSKNNFTYSAKGFAKIENQSSTNLNGNSFVQHNKLKSELFNLISKPELSILNGLTKEKYMLNIPTSLLNAKPITELKLING